MSVYLLQQSYPLWMWPLRSTLHNSLHFRITLYLTNFSIDCLSSFYICIISSTPTVTVCSNIQSKLYSENHVSSQLQPFVKKGQLSFLFLFNINVTIWCTLLDNSLHLARQNKDNTIANINTKPHSSISPMHVWPLQFSSRDHIHFAQWVKCWAAFKVLIELQLFSTSDRMSHWLVASTEKDDRFSFDFKFIRIIFLTHQSDSTW